jgi:hypothetical protein
MWLAGLEELGCRRYRVGGVGDGHHYRADSLARDEHMSLAGSAFCDVWVMCAE